MWNSGKMQRKRSSPSLQRAFLAPEEHLPVERAGCRQVRVGQHRAFGRACRAPGIGEHGHRIRRIADRMGFEAPVVVEEVVEGDAARIGLHLRQHARRGHVRLDRVRRDREFGELADYHRLQPRGLEELLGLRIGRGEVHGDENVGLAVADLEFERVKSVERRIIDDRSARFQDAKEGDHVMGRVRQIEADVHAGLDAELLETGRGAVRKRVELSVGHALVHELQRGLVAETRRRCLQHALQRGDVERDVRADAFRIGLDPRLSGHRLLALPRCFVRLGSPAA